MASSAAPARPEWSIARRGHFLPGNDWVISPARSDGNNYAPTPAAGLPSGDWQG
jgi:hypothetical protein